MGELRVRRGKYFWTRIGPTRAASLGSRGCTGPRSRPQRTQVKGAQMALRPDPHTRPSAEAARSHFLPFLVLAISGSFLSSGCITSSRKALGDTRQNSLSLPLLCPHLVHFRLPWRLRGHPWVLMCWTNARSGLQELRLVRLYIPANQLRTWHTAGIQQKSSPYPTLCAPSFGFWNEHTTEVHKGSQHHDPGYRWGSRFSKEESLVFQRTVYLKQRWQCVGSSKNNKF